MPGKKVFFSSNVNLDSNDIYELSNFIEDELRAKFMTHADNAYFKYDVITEIAFMFGAMMRGEDFISKLQPYLPLTVDGINGYLNYNYAEWRQSFETELDTLESARKGMACIQLSERNEII